MNTYCLWFPPTECDNKKFENCKMSWFPSCFVVQTWARKGHGQDNHAVKCLQGLRSRNPRYKYLHWPCRISSGLLWCNSLATLVKTIIVLMVMCQFPNSPICSLTLGWDKDKTTTNSMRRGSIDTFMFIAVRVPRISYNLEQKRKFYFKAPLPHAGIICSYNKMVTVNTIC